MMLTTAARSSVFGVIHGKFGRSIPERIPDQGSQRSHPRCSAVTSTDSTKTSNSSGSCSSDRPVCAAASDSKRDATPETRGFAFEKHRFMAPCLEPFVTRTLQQSASTRPAGGLLPPHQMQPAVRQRLRPCIAND